MHTAQITGRSRRRLVVGAAASLAAGVLLAMGSFTAADASGATFVLRSGYVASPSQEVAAPASIRIYNGDGAAHHVVSYAGPWSLDVVLQPGQSVYRSFGSWGTYRFRAADASWIDSYGSCHGECASLTVR